MARSVWKGPFVEGSLIKKAEKARGSVRSEVIKTWSRRSTIMPQFVFAVGFAFRLTFVKRKATIGARPAYLHAVRRNLGLMLVAFAVYSVGSRWESWGDTAQRDAACELLRHIKDRPAAIEVAGRFSATAASPRQLELLADVSGVASPASSYAEDPGLATFQVVA